MTFDDPKKQRSPSAARLLELRIGADKGAQTVFPGSVHESGEPIDWENGGERAAAGRHRQCCADRASAGALPPPRCSIRYWPPKGNRHDLSLALGGVLARSGCDVAAIETFVATVVRIAHDPRPADRVRCARDAAEAVADGQQAYGFPKLKEILGDAIADKLADWLGLAWPAAVPRAAGW